jgi:hypothetical protein
MSIINEKYYLILIIFSLIVCENGQWNIVNCKKISINSSTNKETTTPSAPNNGNTIDTRKDVCPFFKLNDLHFVPICS